MRLELTTSAWRADMLPLHQWRIRRTEARLKEGGIYITFILYQIFFQLSNFLKERSRSYTVSAYSVAGEHVLPTTLAALFRGFPTPISHCRYSVRELVPHNPSRDSFWLVRWV